MAVLGRMRVKVRLDKLRSSRSRMALLKLPNEVTLGDFWFWSAIENK